MDLVDGAIARRYGGTHSGAVLDMETERITWALAGLWAFQHQPTMLPNGNLLVFDRAPGPPGSGQAAASPVTLEFVSNVVTLDVLP